MVETNEKSEHLSNKKETPQRNLTPKEQMEILEPRNNKNQN